ncbi:M56 family metallopeptidase [Parapedobacter tibetensis]|uniref:M56 family metallopeptidase n=1 Tax=Parapedobacter tibetensis TaxID=2972951 RepID=UPI00214DB99F|nr:M56 family metallopeptidase [Parapedobacter tibetensis]
MPDIMVYLLKANLSIILFYLGYRFLLRKLTFYNLNRFYLLFALVFSASYPLLDVASWIAKRKVVLPHEVDYLIVDWQPVPTETFSLWSWILTLVAMGSSWLMIRLLIRLVSLWQAHRASRPATWRQFRYRQIFGAILPFSFWRNIYLNAYRHDEKELAEIFTHEQVHVHGLHTLDVLLAELSSICCWFNPGVWLIRHAIQENLEFITDKRVLQEGVDKKNYQYSLLRIGQYAAKNPVLATNFSFRSLKRRIMMMNKKKSSKLNLGRYMLTAPVIAVFVLVFTITKAYERADHTVPESILLEEESEVPSSTLEQGDVVAKQQERQTHGVDPAPIDGDKLVDKTNEGVVADTSRKDTAKINLRGDRQPLYILDGKPLEPGFDLKSLNPKNIERVDVFKDSSATTGYGAKGINGVVVITTKTANKEGNVGLYGIDNADNILVVEGSSITVDSANTLRVRDSSGVVMSANSDFNGALIVIDGKETTAAAIKKLSPNEIEAINVLKGEAAAGKYGAKSAKGVIEIMTKLSKQKQ